MNTNYGDDENSDTSEQVHFHEESQKNRRVQKSPLPHAVDLKDESKFLHTRKTVVLPKEEFLRVITIQQGRNMQHALDYYAI